MRYLFAGTSDSFDLKFGTDTSGIVPLWGLKGTSPNAVFGVRYEATNDEELEWVIGLLQEDFSSFTFIDLGCGKGRTLIVASRLGFGKVVGVEFAPGLAETARKNLAGLALHDVVIVQADAVDFSFPNSDLIVYLFNPFSGEVLVK